MMSGMRNEPPISISSPRDTATSLRSANVLRVNSTAAALLLTTQAASAPVRRKTKSSTWSSRSPRRPASRSNSKLLGPPATATMALMASGGRTARPKLVCSTVPVRLKTGRSDGAERSSIVARTLAAMAFWVLRGRAASPSAESRRRTSSRTARTASVATGRPWVSIRDRTAVRRSTRSTDGTAAWMDGTSRDPMDNAHRTPAQPPERATGRSSRSRPLADRRGRWPFPGVRRW